MRHLISKTYDLSTMLQTAMQRADRWLRDEGPWFATSITAHLVVLIAVMLVIDLVASDHSPARGDVITLTVTDDTPEADLAPPVDFSTPPDIDERPIDLLQPAMAALDGALEPDGEAAAGGTPLAPPSEMGLARGVSSVGPGGGLGLPSGRIDFFPVKGAATGGPSAWSARGRGRGIGGGPVTNSSERAVAAALQWLARHQRPDGGWSLQEFSQRCSGAACTGPGSIASDAAATALALLPFLGAGQTPTTKGSYQTQLQRGLRWLVEHQKADGDLSAGSPQTMYTHGIATIALCEAAGMTGDSRLAQAAQRGLDFIVAAQNRTTGGWRYKPGDPGDTSVVGWQLMALKSGQIAGLKVDPQAFELTRRWLKSVQSGRYGERFAYEPTRGETLSMTAVGLLCSQYLGAKRTDPLIAEGSRVLFDQHPSDAQRNVYLWYYAAQALHNYSGSDWDSWNRSLRRTLVLSQIKEGCAAGSWDPKTPTTDAWGGAGGRVMMTSLSALSLEVNYRMLPLYKNDPL